MMFKRREPHVINWQEPLLPVNVMNPDQTSRIPDHTRMPAVEAAIKSHINTSDTEEARLDLLDIYSVAVKVAAAKDARAEAEKIHERKLMELDKQTATSGGIVGAFTAYSGMCVAGYTGAPALAVAILAYYKGDLQYIARSAPASMKIKSLENKEILLKEELEFCTEYFLETTLGTDLESLAADKADCVFHTILSAMRDLDPRASDLTLDVECLDRLAFACSNCEPDNNMHERISMLIKSDAWKRYDRAKLITGAAIACFFDSGSDSDLLRARKMIENLEEQVLEIKQLGYGLLTADQDFI